MYKIANELKENREALFINTAMKKGMNPAIIEKDFWVCFLLELLFHRSKYQKYFSFKGGTSLSKGYFAIQRFSEDIDLIIDWRLLGFSKDEPWEDRSNTKQDLFNNQIAAKTEYILRNETLPYLRELTREFITGRFEFSILESDPQTIRFVYPQIFLDHSILQEIRLEIGALAAWTPVTQKPVTPYAAEEYPGVFRQASSLIRMVEAKRTFWEKATILHKEANRVNGNMPDRYSRHYYDLFMLSQTPVKGEAFSDLDLLDKVVRFKEKFYRSTWAKYDEATLAKLKLIPSDKFINLLAKDYAMMEGMIFGDKVSFDTIIHGLLELETEIHNLR